MRSTTTSCVLAGVLMLALAGCSDKNDTSVSLSASEAAATTATNSADAASTTAQTLTSTDGKVNIVINQGQFADQSGDASAWVDDSKNSTLTLLQHDDISNITLSVNSLGTPKLKADAYFKNLADELKANSQLHDLKVGMATGNRMNYRFTHTEGDHTLNENCVALYGTDNLYVVCASSDSATDEQLTDVLKNISVSN